MLESVTLILRLSPIRIMTSFLKISEVSFLIKLFQIFHTDYIADRRFLFSTAQVITESITLFSEFCWEDAGKK